MWNIVKTRKLWEITWPRYVTARDMCIALDRLEKEGFSPFWEPFWDHERSELGISFAGGFDNSIGAFPGTATRFEGEYAVDTRYSDAKRETELGVQIGEEKYTDARIYDGDSEGDRRELSKAGHCVNFTDLYWIVIEAGRNGSTRWFDKGEKTLEQIAEEHGGELVEVLAAGDDRQKDGFVLASIDSGKGR